MKYKFYNTSQKAWTAMLHAIHGAKRSIYLETFVFRNDLPEFGFIDALVQKAKEGVRVVVIIDRLKKRGFGSDAQVRLKKAGAEIFFYKRRFWLHGVHRKILIIDEKEAFLGGVNIGKEFKHWLDLHMWINDTRAVSRLLRSFAHAYVFCGGRREDVMVFDQPTHMEKTKLAVRSITEKVRFELLEHWPAKKVFALKKFYVERIRNAKKSVTIVTPYFVPNRWLIKEMLHAVERGVKVEVLFPERVDIHLANVANYIFAHQLAARGITFLLSEKMLHAKVLLIDEQEGLVGSNNIDSQSFDFNTETSLFFDREDMVGDLRKILNDWKNQAFSLSSEKHKKAWYERPSEWVAKIFAPIL